MSDRTVMAVFCDDIRQELGNKIALMGCYQDILFTSRIPAILPKLCVWMVVSTPREKPFISLTIRLMLNGNQELAALTPPIEDLAQVTADSAASTASLRASLIISPFQIDAEGTLQIYVDTEDETLIGPSLALRQAPEPTLH